MKIVPLGYALDVCHARPGVKQAVKDHAFKVLPGVVAALKAMVEEKQEGPFFHEEEHTHPDCALKKARAAIMAAEMVEVPLP